MREYELIVISHPDLDDTGITNLMNRVKGWITEAGGEILKTDLWGKRRLAYPIRKQQEGLYFLIQTKMEPKSGAQFERNLRFTEQILRYSLIVK
jgi:small subunit ribosomal protein S6